MKAVICTKYGGPDVLKLVDVNQPVPLHDEILIKIEATAVNVSDTVIRKLEAPGNPGPIKKKLLETAMRVALGWNAPKKDILGMVSVGRVLACGSDVNLFKVGDEVLSFSGANFGGYAEYKVASESEYDKGALIHKPRNLDFKETAAITYGAVLALHFIKPDSILSGEKVLIYGASGAAGTAALQLAKAQGAIVTAVCSKKNFDLVKALGADKVIDYKDSNASKLLDSYDLVFDAVGYKKTSKVKEKAARSIFKNGRYISVDDSLLKQKKEYLNQLKKYAESGDLKPVIDRIYKLDEIVEAHKYVDSGHKKGNVIIAID